MMNALRKLLGPRALSVVLYDVRDFKQDLANAKVELEALVEVGASDKAQNAAYARVERAKAVLAYGMEELRRLNP